ncbi:hypothetical protein ABID37_004995, partial [Aquamicrobium terrae]
MAMTGAPYPDVVPGPPRASGILLPGSLALPAGMERYEV